MITCMCSCFYRQGGDEFAMVIKGEVNAEAVPLNDFYLGWKREINALALKYKVNEEDIGKGRQAGHGHRNQTQ